MRLTALIIFSAIFSFFLFFIFVPILQQKIGSDWPRIYHVKNYYPAPWTIPEKEGESPLSLAMIHDVIHQRFYTHGKVWYEHRHASVTAALAAYEGKQKDERYFALIDDFAVDCDRLGKPEDGIRMLRDKLNLQQPIGADGQRSAPERAYYTTYANLGTLLIHNHMKAAIAGDKAAALKVREGVGLIEQAMQVNPQAHFGRETWQAVAVYYLLQAIEKPSLLSIYDLSGLPWEGVDRSFTYPHGVTWSAFSSIQQEHGWKRVQFGKRTAEDRVNVQLIRKNLPRFESQAQMWLSATNMGLRDAISYYPQSSNRDFVPSQPITVTFDKPALAYVGIWTLGGGANPHLSLALAHLMDGLGQQRIAWSSYARTILLADKFWPDADIVEKLRQHCRTRQQVLQRGIGLSEEELQAQFNAELAFGEAEQKAYHDYEAERLAAGHDRDDSNFYDDFFKNRVPIASDPGLADTVIKDDSLKVFDAAIYFQAIICLLLLPVYLLRLKQAYDRKA